jgi:hypothetical protein
MTRFLLTISFAILLAQGQGFSQILNSDNSGNYQKMGTFSSTGGAYYNFSSGSGCDLKVGVWGHVLNPGRYSVPCETNLLELLAFCGGPRRGAVLGKVKIIRKGGLDRGDEIKEVFVVDLEGYMSVSKTGKKAQELLITPGDIVVIDGFEPPIYDDWLRWAQVIVAAGSIISSTIYILNYMRNR